MLAEGAAAAVLADPPRSPGSLQRKLPPGRKTALRAHQYPAGEKPFSMCEEETGGLFCSSEGFCDLQKNGLSLVPGCFSSLRAV